MRIQAACWAFSSGVFGALPMLGFLSCIAQDALKCEAACAYKCNSLYEAVYIYMCVCIVYVYTIYIYRLYTMWPFHA